MRTIWIFNLALLLLAGGIQLVGADQTLPAQNHEAYLSISSQGIITRAGGGQSDRQQAGGYALAIKPVRGDFHALFWDLTITSREGWTRTLTGVAGHAFWISRLGRIVAVEDSETSALASQVRILDLEGSVLATRRAVALTDPVLASDGRTFVFRCREGTVALDLETLQDQVHPRLALFAAGPAGQVAGVAVTGNSEVVVFDGRGQQSSVAAPVRLRKLAFAHHEPVILALAADRLVRLTLPDPTEAMSSPRSDLLYAAPVGTELRDLVVTPQTTWLGLRTTADGYYNGELLQLDQFGRVLSRQRGPSLSIPQSSSQKQGRTHEPIPWPLQPNQQRPVGNTYGEYQNYGSSYLHPGVDVMGPPGHPVYAVSAGVIKAILTTSGEYHWRVATGQDTPGASEGYLYAHLEQSSIAVTIGQTVTQGQYLGDLVPWPVANFTHCHFARIQDTGVQWFGDWLNVDNPHLDFTSQMEFESPVFEPARGSDLLAFCDNQTSVYQEPDALHGAVDIIAHVGDRIESDWVCAVQELRYTIAPAGNPDNRLVDDKLAVSFDMVLDTYQGGPIDPFLVDLLYKQDITCNSQGDYDNREFYHILTNSNGDQIYEESDLWEAWDTSVLPDGDYVISVTARDARGNASTITMMVTTDNGHPTGVAADQLLTSLSVKSYPNPGGIGSAISLRLPIDERARLLVYDLAGRLLATLVDSELPAGSHTVHWDGRDTAGRSVAGGTYLLRLETRGDMRTEKFLLVR